jgi:trans-2,3-dihydro-3-hydroxyanthranilate isomerase
MTNQLPYTWVDVFASRPFVGNALVVVSAPADLPTTVMQEVTRELNHSETTFLQPATTHGADYRLRIFIPALPSAREIPFAGHPILGSACVVAAQTGRPTVRFETGVGVLSVDVTPIDEGVWEASMEQPLPRTTHLLTNRAALAQSLGLASEAIRADLPIEAVDNGMQTVLIPLVSLAAVQQAKPNLARLGELVGRSGLCTMLFALGGVSPFTDVHCRVFSPFDAIAEDPATGSANGPMGEYLVRHGLVPGPIIRSEQGYVVGRPSQLTIRVERSEGSTTAVTVSGRVQLVGRGEFFQ